MAAPSQTGQITLRGTPASPGLAAGPIVFIGESGRTNTDSNAAPPEEEATRLRDALDEAVADLSRILDDTHDDEASGMIEFQIAMIEDDSLTEPTFGAIALGSPAVTAWQENLDAEIEGYRASDDEYFQARAIDLEDIRDRVLQHLRGDTEDEFTSGAIVVCDELSPSRFLEHRERIAGIASQRGSSSSHVAILARAQGVPMLIRVQECAADAGASALLDARSGRLTLHPGAEALAEFERLRAADEHERLAAEVHRHRDAHLPSGERVLVLVNVAGPDELTDLDPTTCDGIGLVRTEFLFDARASLPDEDEQFSVYSKIVRWADGRPVTIRTLDAGGDKPIPGLTVDGELNPFLGVRGVRLSLRRPEVFKTQIRALVRTARLGPVKVMLPMVTEPWELERARGLIADALVEMGGTRDETLPFELGIMVEVPACAMDVNRFDADFFSIGSNDLLQYVTACGRDSGELEEVARPDNPALLSLIQDVVAKAGDRGKGVSLCGDMGGDPRYLPLLLERGVRTVSVSPAAIARTKAAVANHGSRNDG